MSTSLGTIAGRKEIPNTKQPELREVTYQPEYIHLGRFSGGKNGVMLQISIDDKHIQLNQNQINLLKEILSLEFK